MNTTLKHYRILVPLKFDSSFLHYSCNISTKPIMQKNTFIMQYWANLKVQVYMKYKPDLTVLQLTACTISLKWLDDLGLKIPLLSIKSKLPMQITQSPIQRISAVFPYGSGWIENLNTHLHLVSTTWNFTSILSDAFKTWYLDWRTILLNLYCLWLNNMNHSPALVWRDDEMM
jgi:hypothetical protein